MKIVYIIPGSGGTFYCQNCLRDNFLVNAMRKAGHDVTIVPMYLPIFSDSDESSERAPVFFGAVNLYLKYCFPWLRKFPDWMLNIFDSPFILRFAAKRAGSTRAAGLEKMTMDMLNGESEIMVDEVEKLVQWLSKSETPDVIHISNALLLGIVRGIKSKLNIPIVCSLQDEHQWVDAMNEPFIDQIWELIAEKAKDVNVFTAVSYYYAARMRKKLKIPAEKLKIVHIGIETDSYPEKSISTKTPAIGFIAKISETSGFGILAEAFLILKSDKNFSNLRLYASGGITSDNSKFIKNWQKKIAKAGFADDFIIESKFDKKKRIELLKKISLLSVPVPGGEAFGIYLLEAMASSVPVVQPDEGGFNEIINKTGGGVVYKPNNAETLAKTLKQLLNDKNKMKKLSDRAKAGVKKHFNVNSFVGNTVKIYEACQNSVPKI